MIKTTSIFVVYQHPGIEGYSVMGHTVGFDGLTGVPDESPLIVSVPLEKAREAILVAGGRINLGRQPDDDEAIVETWYARS